MVLIAQILEKLESPNKRESWQARYRRNKRQKRLLRFELQGQSKPKLPCIVILKRGGVRILDTDNLISAFKWIRDEVADYLIPGLANGRADNDPRIEWRYDQEQIRGYSISAIVVPRDIPYAPANRSQAPSDL